MGFCEIDEVVGVEPVLAVHVIAAFFESISIYYCNALYNIGAQAKKPFEIEIIIQ